MVLSSLALGTLCRETSPHSEIGVCGEVALSCSVFIQPVMRIFSDVQTQLNVGRFSKSSNYTVSL